MKCSRGTLDGLSKYCFTARIFIKGVFFVLILAWHLPNCLRKGKILCWNSWNWKCCVWKYHCQATGKLLYGKCWLATKMWVASCQPPSLCDLALFTLFMSSVSNVVNIKCSSVSIMSSAFWIEHIWVHMEFSNIVVEKTWKNHGILSRTFLGNPVLCKHWQVSSFGKNILTWTNFGMETGMEATTLISVLMWLIKINIIHP